MSRPYLGLHNPEVSPDEYAEIVDRWHDERPTWADVDDSPEPVTVKQPTDPCDDCDHTVCLIQRTVQEWVA